MVVDSLFGYKYQQTETVEVRTHIPASLLSGNFYFSLIQVCQRTARQGARAGRVVTDEPVTGWRITIWQGTHQPPVTDGRRTNEDQVRRGTGLRRTVCIENTKKVMK